MRGGDHAKPDGEAVPGRRPPRPAERRARGRARDLPRLENVARHFRQFDYVFVQDARGTIRARVPHAGTVGEDFSSRDFFEGLELFCGYTVLETGDPLEALAIGERRTEVIDLLLTDMVMPAMRGSELAEHLGSTCPGLHILYMSGYRDEMVAAAAAGEPARLRLHKPLIPEDLARKVREALARS